MRRSHRYGVSNQRIMVECGEFSKSLAEIAGRAIDDITFHQTFAECLLGIGELAIRSSDLRSTLCFGSSSVSIRWRRKIDVHSKGAPPQMFRDGMGVVVSGRLRHPGVFESTELMVKHSNEYHPPKDGQKPQDMYRSLIKDGKS